MSPSEERALAQREFDRLKANFDSTDNILGGLSMVTPFPFNLIFKAVRVAGAKATLDYWYMKELEKFLLGQIDKLPPPPDNRNDNWRWGR